MNRTLKDYGCGMAVDPFGAAGAAHVLADHGRFGAERRPALVPKEHGKRKSLAKVARIGAGGLRARPFAAVHFAAPSADAPGHTPAPAPATPTSPPPSNLSSSPP